MTGQKPPKSVPKSPRADRLGAALRENLKRRKAQAQGRAGKARKGGPEAPNSAGFSGDKPESKA